MKTPVTVVLMLLAGLSLSGCFGGSADEAFDHIPGQDWKPTGNKVVIRMWVTDIEAKEIYPGLEANFWAFCAAPVYSDDAYSAAAIEYRDEDSLCSTPGPTLRVQQGDEVEVRFENDHFHPHTIHWHGQHVPMEADGVPGVTQDSVVEGGTYTYSFVAKRAGTLWYHCHVDGQFHVMMGLYGVMIVEPQDERWEPKDIDREYTLVFSTAKREHIQYVPGRGLHDGHGGHGCGSSGFTDCQNPPADVTPDVFMLNGVSYPNTMEREDTLMKISAGERVRLRLVNSGETFETFHLHGHDMQVTHKDGNPLPPGMRYYTETLPIGPGERYDLVLTGDPEAIGAWVAHTHVEGHITNDRQHPGGMHTMLVYDEFEGDLHAFAAELPGGQHPHDRPIPADHLGDETVVFTALRPHEARDVQHVFSDLPVPDDLCLVDKVAVRARVHTDSVHWPLTDLVLTVHHEHMDEPVRLPLNEDTPSASWSPAFADLKPGNHTITLSGETLEATVQVQATVTYLPSLAAAEQADRPCHDDH